MKTSYREEQLPTVYSWDVPSKLENVIIYFQEKLDEIPKEFRSSATVDIRWEEYDRSLELDISYWRPETEDEELYRLENVRKRELRDMNNKIAQYENLKRELGL